MGYLLKEALKTLCGVNQWSYAVFWKMGYQNPNLLVWEECYYESNSYLTLQDFDASWGDTDASSFQSQYQAGEKVSLLINKMMMDNQVNIVGEGLVGRVAFIRNHQWMLSENFTGEAHPQEVINEVLRQFSAGMKTVAVIPVLPHGVVQFGSYLTIEENLGFIHDVIALVFQLAEVTGVLLSDNYMSKEPARRFGAPVCLGSSTPVDPFLEFSTKYASSFFEDSRNQVESSVQSSVLDTQASDSYTTEIQKDLQSTVGAFQASNSNPSCMKPCDYNHTPMFAPTVRAEVTPTPSNSEMGMNQHTSVIVPRSTLGLPSSTCLLNRGSISCNEQSDSGCPDPFNSFCGIPLPTTLTSYINMTRTVNESITSKSSASVQNNNVNFPKREVSFSNSMDHVRTNSLLGNRSCTQCHHMEKKLVEDEFYTSNGELDITQTHDISASQHNEHPNTVAQLISSLVEHDEKHNLEDLSLTVNSTKHDESYVQSPSGDDLFDILGADFKNKIFSSSWKSCKALPNKHDSNVNIPSAKRLASSEIYASSKGNLNSGISSSGPDHLLDAVVSKVHSAVKPILDDIVSRGTTLTNTSSSLQPNTGFSYSQCGVSNQIKGELLGVPKYTAKVGMINSCSLTNASSKEDSGTCSQISSIYGSQISSWIEKDHNVNPNNSVGCSKKPDETTKPNRKRLKPGDNPRPRPKDRQMIQDRFKELRQIVPNGAKCSMDALLERTIKHMLFLQSVTKHADKLKQTGEPKIIDKDGSLLLKNNFEGGATWAYELGSQSMVCPLIVEDLDQPRQMLVEMLCEERGFFLEIAEIIRGQGLTILKGVMETRNGKIWARFAVEADRDVTRMEIFLTLVHFLEQSSKSCIPQANNASCDKTVVQQIHHMTSLPVTGVSHNLH
ncbi:transcription factor LHW-like [Dorcoceras hygrometricum]|uniref:Transcription factor LHW-like n=1 Tax=Dorcoceras hygrometricum TaxID=472368 RepID=A0A2Z7BEP0_9LAMI|nr:transcription factor LHW-like [Dorcoceras hygrometricum]